MTKKISTRIILDGCDWLSKRKMQAGGAAAVNKKSDPKPNLNHIPEPNTVYVPFM